MYSTGYFHQILMQLVLSWQIFGRNIEISFFMEMCTVGAELILSDRHYLLTYLLTYSKVQSPSWAANWFASSQEIPHISRNPKVHYRTHKRPPPVAILGQPNPIHTPTSHLLEIRPNIIQSSTSRSLSLRFPHQDPTQLSSPHPYAPHAQPISFLRSWLSPFTISRTPPPP